MIGQASSASGPLRNVNQQSGSLGMRPTISGEAAQAVHYILSRQLVEVLRIFSNFPPAHGLDNPIRLLRRQANKPPRPARPNCLVEQLK